MSLTLVSVGLSSAIKEPQWFMFSVLPIVFLKGHQIIDIFMEHKHAPRMWRFMLLSYVPIVPDTIWLIYNL